MSRLSENISKCDRERLFVLLGFIFLISFCFAVHYGLSLVPWEILGGIAALVQMFYVMPQIVQRYYSLNKLEVTKQRYIPIWNEVMVCPSKIAYVALGGIVITAIAALLINFPLDIVGKFLGMHTTIAWGYNCTVATIIFMVITHFVLAVGLSIMFRCTNIMVYQCVGERPVWWIEWIYYVILFIPLVQIASLLAISNKQNTLIKFGFGLEENVKYVEE